jgi:hypothetical protein
MNDFIFQYWKYSTLFNLIGPAAGWNKIVRGGSAYGCFRAARICDRTNVTINIGDDFNIINISSILITRVCFNFKNIINID